MSISVWNSDFESMDEYVDVYVDDLWIDKCDPSSNSCDEFIECVNDYSFAEFANDYSHSINDTLSIRFDVHNNNAYSKCKYDNESISFVSKIDIECYVPPNPDPWDDTTMHIDLKYDDLDLHYKAYNNFTFSIQSDYPGYNSPNYTFYLYASDIPCLDPMFTILTFDTDYDEFDEFIDIFVNGKYDSTCNPDSNSCSKWYKCLETHLIDSQINDFITFQFNSNGNGLGCNRISFWTNVTLSCYIATDPTAHPTVFPTQLPTVMPSLPTQSPTLNPTLPPTSNPSAEPSLEPTKEPSNIPTAPPTMQPTSNPSTAPSMEPTREPSDIPTAHPTSDPTSNPTRQPTSNPSAEPSLEPTKEPSDIPTATTSDPTSAPTGTPTLPPTHPPTQSPTSSPSYNPSNNPTMTPTFSPTHMPTVSPTFSPTHAPTAPNNILYIDLQQSAIDGHYNAYHLPLPIGVNASRGFVSFQ
eukprot:38497_1